MSSAWIVLATTLAGLATAAVFLPPPPPTDRAAVTLAPPLVQPPEAPARRSDSVILQRQGAASYPEGAPHPLPMDVSRSPAKEASPGPDGPRDQPARVELASGGSRNQSGDPALSIRRLLKASQSVSAAVFPDPVTLAAHALPAPPTDIPWSDDEQSRIAVIVTGLGLSEGTTRAALALPAGISLSFSPYAPELDRWAALARAGGHPVFLDLPLRTDSDSGWRAGPLALSAADAWTDNEARLDTLVRSLPNLRGMVAMPPQGFLDYHDPTTSLLAFLARRGLTLVDPRREAGRELAQEALRDGRRIVAADVDLTEPASLTVRTARLTALLHIAREHGRALLLTRADPTGLELLAAWSGTLADKDVLLVSPDQLSGRPFPATETASR